MAQQTSVLMYGDSGSTKTTQLYQLAKKILADNPGTHIRMVHADPGGYAPFEDSGMIERGDVRVFEFRDRQNAIADFARLSEGYWPVYLDSKNAAYELPFEGSKTYLQSDEYCRTPPEKMSKVAAYFVEGFTSIGDALLTHISTQEDHVAFKGSYKHTEDGYTMHGLSEGHYGFVQKAISDKYKQNFRALPVKWMVWTALESKSGVDSAKNLAYGPSCAGNKLTQKLPSWFTHTIHLAPQQFNDGKNRIVAWFMQHPDSTTGIMYPAKTRLIPELLEQLNRMYPFGNVVMSHDKGIQEYFEAIEQLNKMYREKQSDRNNVPV